jgi:uncharacterized protein (DUF58 family)
MEGASPDFQEYKEYSPGDSLRHIDWRVYGRLDRLYLKRFEDEVSLSWCFLIDRSGSMGYGSKISKLRYALKLSATLAYLLLLQGDRVAVADFSSGVTNISPQVSTPSGLFGMLAYLESLSASGGSGLGEPIARVVESLRGGGAIVILSDFLSDPDLLEESLKLLRFNKKPVVAFHVLDPSEIEFPFEGSCEFEDLEDDLRISVVAEDVRKVYRRKMEEFMGKVAGVFYKNGASYVLATTDTPVEDVLIEIASR